ncbi:hypothetical protein [Candidatus Thioglobus sp.]|jgi:hypothetical protein|uniref:hypothetical protein n=1 Tax=Candidatus Thioglobus sp. TaxID=2026721 RepID=UPI0032429168
MKGRFKQIIFVALLGFSVSVYAEKTVFYTDSDITIYSDNSVVYTGKKAAPVFKPSATWVEEDYFTQQEKYCEVDSNYAKKMEKSLKNKNN